MLFFYENAYQIWEWFLYNIENWKLINYENATFSFIIILFKKYVGVLGKNFGRSNQWFRANLPSLVVQFLRSCQIWISVTDYDEVEDSHVSTRFEALSINPTRPYKLLENHILCSSQVRHYKQEGYMSGVVILFIFWYWPSKILWKCTFWKIHYT